MARNRNKNKNQVIDYIPQAKRDTDYGFEMSDYVKSLLYGTNEPEKSVPSDDDFKIDPSIFEHDFDTYVIPTIDEASIPRPEPTVTDENPFSDLFEKSEKKAAPKKAAQPVPMVADSAKAPQENEAEEDEEEDDDNEFDPFSTRELRHEMFTKEFDDKFREMFTESLDNEDKKFGTKKLQDIIVTPEEIAAAEGEEPITEEAPAPKPKKSHTGFLVFLLLISIAVFVYAGYQFATTYLAQKNEADEFNSLATIVAMAENGQAGNIKLRDSVIETELEDDGSGRIYKYQQLAALNPNMIGWLNIPDSDINYPVMQTPDDPEYYLHRDFFNEYSFSGTIFVDANCDIEESDNQIIYGHNMKNDTMFGALDLYADKEYWENHQYIYYDSVYEPHVYQVCCVFKSRILDKGEPGFRYYRFYGSENEQEFEKYVENIKKIELYDTGIEMNYGDKLITLSTCARYTEAGRFVVVAKQIS